MVQLFDYFGCEYGFLIVRFFFCNIVFREAFDDFIVFSIGNFFIAIIVAFKR